MKSWEMYKRRKNDIDAFIFSVGKYSLNEIEEEVRKVIMIF